MVCRRVDGSLHWRTMQSPANNMLGMLRLSYMDVSQRNCTTRVCSAAKVAKFSAYVPSVLTLHQTGRHFQCAVRLH